MYPRIPKTTVAMSNKSVKTSIVVMSGHPLSGERPFHIPVGAIMIPRRASFVNFSALWAAFLLFACPPFRFRQYNAKGGKCLRRVRLLTGAAHKKIPA